MKNMDDNYFEEHFREAFSDFEAPPSEEMWNAIQPSIPVQKKKVLLWRRAAVVAVILLAIPSLLGDYSEGEEFIELPSGEHLSGITASGERKRGNSDLSVAPRNNADYHQETPEIIAEEETTAYSESNISISSSTPQTLAENSVSSDAERSQLLSSTVRRNGITEMAVVALPPRTVGLVPITQESRSQTSEASSREGMNMYLAITPFLGYQQFSPSSQDLVLVREAESLSSLHPSRIGFQGSWGVELPVSRRLQFSAGLLYRFLPQQISLDLSSWEHNTATLVEGGVQLTPQFQSASQGYSTLSHSVGGRALLWYSLAPKHQRQPQFGAGVQATRLLNPAANDNELHQPAWQPSVTAAYRIVYPLKPGWYLNLQPTFNYPVLLGKDNRKLLSTRPYFFGIGVQLNY
ncbi:MAG: hypothetical protein AAF944_07330 [Bacteroidota bacterium]